jgi:hypothetical protein
LQSLTTHLIDLFEFLPKQFGQRIVSAIFGVCFAADWICICGRLGKVISFSSQTRAIALFEDAPIG